MSDHVQSIHSSDLGNCHHSWFVANLYQVPAYTEHRYDSWLLTCTSFRSWNHPCVLEDSQNYNLPPYASDPALLLDHVQSKGGYLLHFQLYLGCHSLGYRRHGPVAPAVAKQAGLCD